MLTVYISSVWGDIRFRHARPKAYMKAQELAHKRSCNIPTQEELHLIQALREAELESQWQKRRFAV